MGSRNCRPWVFERLWRGQLMLAIKVTGDFQDRWLRSPDEFSSRQWVAVMVRIFSLHNQVEAGDWSRRPEVWCSLVGAPEEECLLLHPGLDPDQAGLAVGHLSDLVSNARASWLSRSVADPSTESLADAFLKQLSADGVATVQYG